MGYLIFGIICLSIIAIILINNIIIAINLHLKNKRIKNKEHALYSLIAQQYDLSNLLIKMLLENGVELPSDLELTYDVHNDKTNLTTMEQYNLKLSIVNVINRLVIYAENSSLKDNEKYKSLKFSLDDFNLKYRKEVVLVNQDIYAYNYWVGFFFFRPISFIFKLKKKDFIQ